MLPRGLSATAGLLKLSYQIRLVNISVLIVVALSRETVKTVRLRANRAERAPG